MKKNIVYLLLILLLLITTLYGVVNRINIEKNLKSVEVTLDYNDFNEMSKESDFDIVWWFNYLEKLGVKSVSVEEESISSLIEEGNALESTVLINLKKDAFWYKKYPSSFVKYIKENNYDKNDVVILSSDEEVKSFILNGLKEKYEKSFYKIFEENNTYAILLDGKKDDLLYSKEYKFFDEKGKGFIQNQDVLSSKLEYYKLGFSDEKIQNVLDSNLDLNLRPTNNKLFPKKQLEYYKKVVKKYSIDQRYMIFTGKQIIGYPDIEDIKDYMEENNIAPALIETQVQRSNIPQKGLKDLVEELDYKAVRVLPIVQYIQERYKYFGYEGAEEIENVIFRAVTERNIRLIYYRPFLENEQIYVSDPDEYKISFDRLKGRLHAHNISLGSISIMKEHFNSIYYSFLISVGILGLLAYICKKLFSVKDKYLYLLIIGFSLIAFLALKVAPNLSNILLSFGVAIITGFIGALCISFYTKNTLIRQASYPMHTVALKSVIFTILMSFIPLIGGFIIASVLSGSNYLLEMNFYRGVKLSEVLPILIFIISYILILGFNRDIDDMDKKFKFKEILNMLNFKIRIFHIILGAIGGMVLILYVARSGHESGIEPMKLEIIFRNLLENKFIVRPRLKEFIIAIPSLMILSYSAYKVLKKLIFVFSLGSMIAFTSIVNTFCHLRTPLYVSILRTFIGLGFGIVIGLILIGILEIIRRFINKQKIKKEVEL